MNGARSPWALRYSVRRRNGEITGTITVELRTLARGRTPLEAATATLRTAGIFDAEPILPRAVLAYPEDASPRALELVAIPGPLRVAA